MRKIKFRVWDGKSFLKPTNRIKITLDGKATHKKGYSAQTKNWEIQQFTGLKDSKGHEIYEGDILKFYKNKPYEAIYEVIWQSHGFSLVHPKGEGDDFGVYTKSMDFVPSDDPVIIGNIFENPNLTKIE